MTTEWKDLAPATLEAMKTLGNFGPTVRKADRLIKGCMLTSDGSADFRVYFDSDELRAIAIACNEVAAWLDERANKEQA